MKRTLISILRYDITFPTTNGCDQQPAWCDGVHSVEPRINRSGVLPNRRH